MKWGNSERFLSLRGSFDAYEKIATSAERSLRARRFAFEEYLLSQKSWPPLKALSEQLVARFHSLEDRKPFAFAPDDQPVTGVVRMTRSAARPAIFQVMRTAPSSQLLERFRRIPKKPTLRITRQLT